MLRNLRDLPGSLTFSAVVAALVAVLVGYTGPLLIVVQAAENAGLDRGQLSSWIWALTVGSGVSALVMSLRYRQPLLAAWPVAGVALLATTLPQYNYAEAIGAYLVAAVGLIALGWSGFFGRVMDRVPRPVIAGMLAGVLVRFGLGVFRALADAQVLVGAMILTYLLLRRLNVRAPTIGTLGVGLVVAGLGGQLQFEHFAPALTVPVWQWPVFTFRSVLGLSLPLFMLANVSQNAPGLAVLRSFGYKTEPDGPILITGVVSLLTAPFGGSGLSLAAITAALCVSPEAHPDPDRRYAAGVAYGFWYILFGLFGATAVTLFAGMPRELIAAVAGLALTGALITALTNAMAEPKEREGALLAFLCTAADITLLGIGAPFWGLVLGVAANLLLQRRQ
jgi:benzoate membrane transport protein